VNAAVGASGTSIRLHVADTHSTAAEDHFAAYKTITWAKNTLTGQTIEVPVQRLDAILEAHAIAPGFELLVVDVEGYEPEVFASFDLRAWRPRMLIVELPDPTAAYVRAHPRESAAMWLRRAVVFWLPPYHEGLDAANQSRAETTARLVWLIEWLAIVALALSPLLVREGRSRFALGLYATVALYTAIHLPVYVIFRYRLPMMPLLCILAGIGVAAALSRLTARRAAAVAA
jgi:hypothetical protein